MGGEDSEPEIPLLPDHSPDAVQVVAPVVVQESVAVLPDGTEQGPLVPLHFRSTVGVRMVTTTFTLSDEFPPGPVHEVV